MKKIIISTSILLSLIVKSQTKAMTEDGKEVVLFDNKTWKFVNDSDENTLETINTNNQPFEKAKDATFLAKSKKVDAGFYYNPKTYKIVQTNFNSPAIEYVFSNTANPNIFALFASENAPVQTLKNLQELVLLSVQRNVTFFKLKEAEYRTVNNLRVLHMKYSANTKGLDFEYIGNYYLTGDGYCSITTYTFANQFEDNKKSMENLLNGLVKVEKSKITEIIETGPPPPMSRKNSK
ncbi:hypothetical protein [Chryseobacterium sp.]|uniref:hypothetical protein n=1 Tax=Chryseobacterium sp. TaxID=1871047 RepID=UPI0028A11528|nr:hypothetical protein [Chryseobacterium sp.]